ncbi:MFS multidrug transporter-like protein [Bisporella sp. PMI_857]|nr:MFS multidrug transporter-like protein [Bisporella sp. PMI_857]
MSTLRQIERILSRSAAKPYRSKHIENETPYLNQNGHLDFAPGDIENPQNWSKRRRWYITIVSVFLVVNATFASSGPSGMLKGPNGIVEYFGVSTEAAALVISLFLLGYCFGPLFWAPLSEFYGRRWIFYISFTGYFLLNFLCAFAPNFGALLAGRFLTGTFASSPLSNVAGVLVDIWGPLDRGNAMALFSIMTFVGPALGPVIAGFLELKRNWRWNFYALLWLASITEVLMFTIPETYPPQILLNKAKRIRRLKIPGFESVQTPVEALGRSLMHNFKVALSKPWVIMFDLISLLIAIYLSVVYALLYMLFTIYPIVFRQKRGWNAGVSELPLIGTAIGACLGGAIIFLNTAKEKKKVKAGFRMSPENRLSMAMIGGAFFPVTLFWFGWTANFDNVPWIVPTIAGGFLSTSIVLIFVSHLNYLTDTYLLYAASALAANTVLRSAAGAAAPLFTPRMFNALGVGGGASLIGGVAVLLMPIPFVFYKYGRLIRKRSKFAPTDDKPELVPRPSSTTSSVIAAENSHSSQKDVGRQDGIESGLGYKASDNGVDNSLASHEVPRVQAPGKDLEKGIFELAKVLN